MAANSTTYDPVLAELWPQKRINNLAFSNAKFAGYCQRSQDFTEKVKHVALQYGNNQGRSASFSAAKSNVGSSKFEEFEVTIVSNYGYGEVDGLTLERTESNRAALVNALDREAQGALDELTADLGKDTWKTGSGALGQIAAGGISGTTITLESGQAKQFEVDMVLRAAATETGATRAAGTNTMTVTAVDYDAETIEVDATITGLTAADYLFVDGDAADGGSLKKITGVASWVPVYGATIGTLFGMTRTTHVTRLAGHRLDGSGLASKEVAIKKLIAQIRNRSNGRGKPNMVWLNPEDMDDLDTELGAKRSYEKIDVPGADIGFDAIMFRGPGGTIAAIDDPWIPEGNAWACDMRTWHYDSLKASPRIIQHDGQRVSRLNDSDGIELRAVGRHQYYCDAPGWNGHVLLP